MIAVDLNELDLKSSYESGIDDLVQDFYIPVLSCAISYDRIAGFFSSSSLAIAAQGISEIIKNGGKMRLLASPKLSAGDYLVIEAATIDPEKFISDKLILEISDIKNEFERDHVQALGWMLANRFLEIKIAKVANGLTKFDEEGIFHQKVGIVKDSQGNVLSFSGSLNESASGWLHNIEEFKVFRYWKPGQEEFVDSDNKKFEDFWNNQRDNVEVSDLPKAVEQRLLEQSSDFSIEQFCAKYYLTKKKQKKIEDSLSLFPYQKEAVDLWEKNDYRLLFEMATGTGKTRTAIACINKLLENKNKLLVIISCPQNTLSRQWQKEIEGIGIIFDAVIIADGTNNRWRRDLSTELIKINTGFNSNAVIYTTHLTGSVKDFISIMETYGKNLEICFVGDEAHGLGAYKTKQGLLSMYKYRIGLSATPKRWFDDEGTKIITSFFGDKSFEFTIAQALTTINPLTNRPFLVNYYYHPIFVKLTEEELEEYKKLSLKISKLATYAENDDKYQKNYEYLLFARANIQKNATNKLVALQKLISSKLDMQDTLIFTSEDQIDDVMQILKQNKIFSHRFTQDQGTISKALYGGLSERQYLIKCFKKHEYKALVAISCLDEGIDIPSADTAIIMSSSTNPREYIQRIGRVIRQSPNKTQAHIFDFIIEPDLDSICFSEMVNFEIKIFRNEMNRVIEMSSNALNNAEVQMSIDDIIRRLNNYGSK